jgi:hypothetical protein
MTKQPQVSADSATPTQDRAMQPGPIESMTQYQPDAQLRPLTRNTHQGILIEWWDSCTNPKTALVGVGAC